MHGALIAMMTAGLSGAADAKGEPRLYEEMSPEQLSRAVERHPVAFVSAGIVEWHGEQSACGLDALKAETLCRMAARQLGGVCFPTFWTGPGGSTPFDPAKYPRGTLTIDKELYLAAAEELLSRIEAMGFKVAVYLSGHYPGVIPDVAEKFNRRGRMKVISVSENQVVRGMPAGDHAAAWETSMLMVLRPGLVDLTRLPALPSGVKHAGEKIPPAWPFYQRCEYYGVYGADPRVWANCHFGKRGTQAVIDGLARVVGEALGDSSYGSKRGEVAFPEDTRQQPEVRYDYLLPYQWMERFEQTAVVYWPLPAVGESLKEATDRAALHARRTGGMVFPAFSYGPPAGGQRVAVSPDVFERIAREVVSVLAEMDFRVIVLLPGSTLEPAARKSLDNLQMPGGQARAVVVDPSDEESAAAMVNAAMRAMLPQKSMLQHLDGEWTINGQRTVKSLTEGIYGPPAEVRVYEHTFELAEAEAKMAALLDLGTVENHCEVTLNDSPTLADHWPPYRFIVTGRLRPGANKLQIVVRHKVQPTLDEFYYRVAPPRLRGPVELRLWH